MDKNIKDTGGIGFEQEMDCICFENEKMGIYFITDPDEYWLEIVPVRK